MGSCVSKTSRSLRTRTGPIVGGMCSAIQASVGVIDSYPGGRCSAEPSNAGGPTEFYPTIAPEHRRRVERQKGISSSSGSEGAAFGGGVALDERGGFEP